MSSYGGEVRRLAAMFGRNGKFAMNEFNTEELPFADYPHIIRAMDECLDGEGSQFVPAKKVEQYSVAIQPNHFEVQWHNVSIGEHTDDMKSGEYFQLYVLKLRREAVAPYTDRPVINYYTPDRHKIKKELSEGDSIVFAPKSPHSVIYYGDSFLVALRTVVRSGKGNKR